MRFDSTNIREHSATTARSHSPTCLFVVCVVSFYLLFAATAALAQIPAAAAAQFRQAAESMRNGDLDSAGSGFAAVIKQAPAFAEAHFNFGLVQEEKGRHAEAIGSFQKALTLKPRLHGANLFLGVAHYKLNQFDEAIVALKKETAAYPKDAGAWMWLGVVSLAKDRPEEAAAALDKAATLAPNDVDILYHRGQAHLLVSKNSYARMFTADPKSWRVHQVLAQANAEAEHHTDAIAEYEEAIKLAPTQTGLHEELGSEYRNARMPEQAAAAFQRELVIDPYNVLAKYKLGVLALERGDGAQAKEFMEAALREKPDLHHADYILGRAELQLGNDSAAMNFLKRSTALETDPEFLQQSWYQLGIAYRRLHRTAEAQQAMATFLKLKDEAAEASQKRLKKFEVHPSDDAVAAPTSPPTDPPADPK
jgi:tetratricopeptide (TPR) repeat protein